VTAGPVEVHLVPMRRRHLRQVIQIENEVEAAPWSLSLLLAELARPAGRFYVVARVRGRVAGYAGLLISLDEAHVTKIAVDPVWQRQQIGSRMMVNLTRAALALEARHMTLEVRVSNEPAIAMYRRFGFEVEGTRKGYYAESKEDAYVMWAHDIVSAAYAAKVAAIEAAIIGSTRDETPVGTK
jgi:ribosomal-protein-alanine N-acetyltransferase